MGAVADSQAVRSLAVGAGAKKEAMRGCEPSTVRRLAGGLEAKLQGTPLILPRVAALG
jgi:hypothetical protein